MPTDHTPLLWVVGQVLKGRGGDAPQKLMKALLALPQLDVSGVTVGGTNAILRACHGGSASVDILEGLLSHASCRDVHLGSPTGGVTVSHGIN